MYSRLPDELKPGSGKLKKKKKADMSKLAIQNTMQALEKEEVNPNSDFDIYMMLKDKLLMNWFL